MSERNKLLIAIAVSIVLHLVGVGVLTLAALIKLPAKSDKAESQPEVLQKPMKLVVVAPKATPTTPPASAAPPPPSQPQPAVPPPLPPAKPPTVVERREVVLSSEGLRVVQEAPKNATRESDVNSVFASEKQGVQTGERPAQSGADQKFEQFENKEFTLQSRAAPTPVPTPAATPVPQSTAVSAVQPTGGAVMFQPTPVPRKAAKPKRSPTPTPAITMAKNVPPQSAPTETPLPVRRATTPAPTPPVTSVATPTPGDVPNPAPAFRPETRKTKMDGSASENVGPASVEAENTPRGVYLKKVYDAVGSRWYDYMGRRSDLMMVGEALIEFSVTEDGTIENPRILSNTGNETFGTYCFQSVVEAKPPPLPPIVASTSPSRRLTITLRFTLHP